MEECCLISLIREAIRDDFKIYPEGSLHTCELCDTVLKKFNGKWCPTFLVYVHPPTTEAASKPRSMSKRRRPYDNGNF